MSAHKTPKGRFGAPCSRCGKHGPGLLQPCTPYWEEREKLEREKEMGAKTLAKQIVAYRAFKPTPDPKCRVCNGTGSYKDEHPHNGSEMDVTCDCTEEGRPVDPHLSIWDDDLLKMAKSFLKGS